MAETKEILSYAENRKEKPSRTVLKKKNQQNVNSNDTERFEATADDIIDKEIDTSDLYIGECVKNYKELCRILKQPTYAGDQKKAQLEDFQRYFEYEKVGVKFYITDIYEEPIKKGYKYPANALYIQHVECLILQCLLNADENKILISSRYLWHKLGMINGNYINMQKEALLNLDEDMSMFYVNDFYKRCGLKLHKIIKTSLDSLKRRKVINYWDRHIIKYSDGSYRESTDIEEEVILSIEKEILNEMGLKEEKEIFLKNLQNEFYTKRNEKAKEIGAKSLYDCYKIIHIKENTIAEMNEAQIRLQRLMLNEKVVDSINSQAEKAYEKSLSKDFVYPEKYVEMQHLLSDTLLKLQRNKL